MNDLLRKLGLSDNTRFEVRASRTQLVDALKAHIDPPTFSFFDTYAKGHELYRGTVTPEGFDILRTHRRHERKIGTRAIGKFTSHGDQQIIEIRLTAFHPMQIPFIILGVLVYVITFWAIVTDRMDNSAPWMLPALFIHAAIMFGVPFWFVRMAVRKSKAEIERNIRGMLGSDYSRR